MVPIVWFERIRMSYSCLEFPLFPFDCHLIQMKTPRLDSCNFLEYPIMVLKQRTLLSLPVFWLVFLNDPLFSLISILNKSEYEINSPKVDEKYIILSFFLPAHDIFSRIPNLRIHDFFSQNLFSFLLNQGRIFQWR